MGACSSKPKTKEFEGSTEPAKKNEDVCADRSINAMDAARASHQNEPIMEDQGAADVGAEVVQETHSLIVSKDEEPLIKEPLSIAEGVSYRAEAESSAVDGEPGDRTAEKAEANVGDAQKVDVGDGCKEASEKITTVDDGVGKDQEKGFENKAVVLDEESNGDTYIDKAVTVDEGKPHECADKGSGSATLQDEESENLEDIKKAAEIESPITGVVHVVEPIQVDDASESVGPATSETTPHLDSKGSELAHVNDVSESVGLESPETTAHSEPKVSKSLDEIERDVCTGPNIGENGIPPTEEVANLLSSLPHEAPAEKEEGLHNDSKETPLLVSVLEDGVDQKSGADDSKGEEASLAFAVAQDETRVEDTGILKTSEDTQNDIKESTPELKEERLLEKSAKELCVEVMKNETNAEVLSELKPDAPKVQESTDIDMFVEPKPETILEQGPEGHGEGIVDEPKMSNVQLQALVIEETTEDAKPDALPNEAIAEPSVETDRVEKIEKPHIEEASTNESKVESLDAGHLDLSIEQVKKGSEDGDIVFEDASDVPLKVEPSTSELGNKPDS